MIHSLPIKKFYLILFLAGVALPLLGQPKTDSITYEGILNLLEQDRYDDAFRSLGRLEEEYYNTEPDKPFVEFLLEVVYLLNSKGSYEPALNYSFYVLELCQTEEFLSLQKTESLLEIGSAYYFLGMPDLSLMYSKQALELANTYGYKKQIAAAINKVGLYYETVGDLEASLREFEKCLLLREEINDIHGQSATLGNIGTVSAKLGMYDKALEFQLRSLALDSSIHDTLGVAWSYQLLGGLSTTMGNYPEATNYLELAEKQAKKLRSNELLLQTYHSRKELMEVLGEYEKAIKYTNRYEALRDSIHNKTILGRTALFQGTYELNRKSRELEAQKLTLSWQRNFILLGIAVAFVISVLASFYFRSFNRVRDLNREIEKQNEEIIKKSEELTKANAELAVLNQDISEQKEEIQAQAEELTESHETIIRINQHLEEKVAERTSELAQAYKELDTFFYRASHDFRRPLTTFMGLSEVAKITVKDENALELFEKVRLTASNLDKMLMKLQSISDVGLQHLSYREVFSNDIFNVLFTTYGDEFGSKDVSFQTEASIASFYSYPTIIKLIVDNLVENAIQFRRQRQAFVKVKIYKQDSEIIISVIDNGQGIDAQYQDQIFNMYFRGSENSNGNGLGLYIIKKAVEKLNGRISFTSVYNSGSTFSVFFPTEKS